jgi:hypothetical protein
MASTFQLIQIISGVNINGGSTERDETALTIFRHGGHAVAVNNLWMIKPAPVF